MGTCSVTFGVPADIREVAGVGSSLLPVFWVFLDIFDSFIVKVVRAYELDPRKGGRRNINE